MEKKKDFALYQLNRVDLYLYLYQLNRSFFATINNAIFKFIRLHSKKKNRSKTYLNINRNKSESFVCCSKCFDFLLKTAEDS